jgi:hypothetical protein
MKLSLTSAIAAGSAALALTFGAAMPAQASPGGYHGGGYHGGGYHGGGYHGGGYHGGYWHGGYWRGGYWWPGYWGAAVGLGIGLGLGGYYVGNAWYPDYPAYAVDAPPVVYDVTPRAGTPVPAAPAAATAPDPVIYPRKGQSAAQQESDHRACNRWAASQQNAMNDGNVFQRAVQACMDGRGYTLR